MSKKTDQPIEITINPPNLAVVELLIRGTEPLVVARFSKKAELMAKMAEGPSAKNKKDRKARDYDAEANEAKHISTEGWEGVCASGFRSACIAACRLVNYKMTMAKMSLFVLSDGLDRNEFTPLVRLYGDSAETFTAHTRNASGVADIRSRPIYKKWGCVLKIRYDQDQFTAQDIVNLVARAGLQVGICEGRPGSRDSAGLGFGIFEIVPTDKVTQFKKEYGIK
jgi:hypothetical protein